jgi:hypothetical protein
MATLSDAEYESRKRFLGELKSLSKTESAKMFEILKKHKTEYSENSNGVFFDLMKLPKEAFDEIEGYMEFCKTVQCEQKVRDENERLAQDMLR